MSPKARKRISISVLTVPLSWGQCFIIKCLWLTEAQDILSSSNTHVSYCQVRPWLGLELNQARQWVSRNRVVCLSFIWLFSLIVCLSVYLVFLSSCRGLCWLSRLRPAQATQHLPAWPQDLCLWWGQGANDCCCLCKGLQPQQIQVI